MSSISISGRLNRRSDRISVIRSTAALSNLKLAIWGYFLLLIFEGALRKWFLPSLAGPLLVIRDPLVLWIVLTAWRRGFLNMTFYGASIFYIGIFSLYTAYFLGHGNLVVALFGARIFLLHFPLIFIIAEVFDKEDVIRIARCTLWISIPMTMLIILQFYSPQTAWVNKSVGGEAGGGFSGALNFFRPPGTFSFTNGNTLFYNFAACFVIYFWFNKKEISRIVLLASTVAVLLSIPFSISRSLFFQVIISLLFAFFSVLMKPKNAGGLILIFGALIGLFVLLASASFFSTAMAAFTARFESANSQEGGLNSVFIDRFLGGLIGAINESAHQPFFGYGIGMGTNVGSVLLSGGRGFLISEGEWGRLLGELGPILGLSVIFIRLQLMLKISFASLNKLRSGNIMPWMLTSFGFLSIAQAGWAQPTSLGFCILITGLILASLKDSEQNHETVTTRNNTDKL